MFLFSIAFLPHVKQNCFIMKFRKKNPKLLIILSGDIVQIV